MRTIALTRPEGGAERDVYFERRHKCPQGNALQNEFPGCDVLIFPVGLCGWEMPLDIPFEVPSSDACEACGSFVSAMFMWKGPKLILPSVWTP